MMLICRYGVLLSLAGGLALGLTGCGPADTGRAPRATGKPVAEAGGGHNYKGRDWCPEHGMPESVCAQCDEALAKKYRAKGDWCNEHDVPKSQCFQCDPTLKEKFAQEYRDKYGEDPPPVK